MSGVRQGEYPYSCMDLHDISPEELFGSRLSTVSGILSRKQAVEEF